MKTSAAGRSALIKREGVRLKAYKDSVGVWSIGVGHTSAAGPPKVTPGLTITMDECDAIFARDLVQYENAVNKAVKVKLAQNEFDALVSFCYNIGTGGFARSTVVKKLNAGDKEGAADAFMNWVKPPEITGRRRTERKQFLTPYAPVQADQPVSAPDVAPDADKPQEGNVPDVPTPPDGDPEVFMVQRRLQQMNYQPGKLDGRWGGNTSGAIAGFLNDIPGKPSFPAPVSDVDFRKVLPDLKAELTKAEAAGFTRPISVERKTATASDIPGNKTVQQTWLARMWAKALTIFGGGSVGFGVISDATDTVKGPLDWAKENTPTFLTKWWFWAGLAALGGAAIWKATRHAEQATINDYREGRLT